MADMAFASTREVKAQKDGTMTIEVYTAKNGKRTKHEIDPRQVDELDEISGDEQLALVWCETHQTWEWHWVDRDLLPGGRQ